MTDRPSSPRSRWWPIPGGVSRDQHDGHATNPPHTSHRPGGRRCRRRVLRSSCRSLHRGRADTADRRARPATPCTRLPRSTSVTRPASRHHRHRDQAGRLRRSSRRRTQKVAVSRLRLRDRQPGDIVTNDHVVAGASGIRVGFSGGSTYPAKVVGADPRPTSPSSTSRPASALHPLTFDGSAASRSAIRSTRSATRSGSTAR